MKQCEILIIEDDVSIAEGLTTRLEDEGYKVGHALNGRLGLDFLKTHNDIKLILFDLMMPIMDGYLFRAHQLLDPALSSIPVIILTAGAPDLKRLNAMNVAAHFKKPVNVEKLIGTIGRYVNPDKSVAYDALAGGNEMGALIRSMDWAKTPLGPVESWPQSLRTTVSLCLSSTFPILITWGPDHVQIYNDTYRPICGDLHPQSMGQRFKDCWATALPVVGEVFDRAWSGTGSYIENQRMFLDRHGYLEEAFMTFSFSPIRDESGEVGGLFHPITETTDRMLTLRRTQAVRDFSTQLTQARTENEVADLTAKALGLCPLDIPFFLIYQLDESGKTARLLKCVGLRRGEASTPELIDLGAEMPKGWPVAEVARSLHMKVVNDLDDLFGPLICEPYPESLREAVILPISISGVDQPFGFFIAGISARRACDGNYLSFYEFLGNALKSAYTQVRAYEEEKKTAAALVEIDRAKTSFFSNVSHEFRTPLTLMLGPLEENLAHPDLAFSPGHRERDELAYRSARRLLKLVNSLLDFSRIEAGRMDAEFRPTDLSQLTIELSGMFRAAIEKGGLQFIVKTSDLHEAVYVDREMWEKIVLNLLSNAFKFTLQGKIEVELSQSNGRVQLIVRDTGIGVSEVEVPRLFERFHRVEGVEGRTQEGTGIGLALIEELVKIHGGTISVQSKLGQGTQFTVDLLLGKEHLPAHQVKNDSSVGPISTIMPTFIEEAVKWLPEAQISSAHVPPVGKKNRARILIADDNADMRSYLQNILKTQWDIEVVSDGEAALARATSHLPDLILSDVMMPKMDGFELIKRLKDDSKTKTIPVILLSARAGESSRVEGLDTGADDYLVKPFSAKELIARVKTHLEIGRLRAEALFQQEKIFSVFMQAPAAVAFLKGADLTFEIANARYLALVGKGDSIVGKPIRQALPELEEATFMMFEKVYKTGEALVVQEYESPLDGPERKNKIGYFNFLLEQITDVKGEPEGILIFGYEVTDQVCARKDTEKLTSSLQSAVKSRDEFMAIASHELKTPLTSLILQLQLTKHRIKAELGEVSSEQLMNMSLKHSDRVSRLVNDLFDVTRMQAGKLAFNFEEINVGELIQEVANSYCDHPALARNPIEVRAPLMLIGRWDRSRIEQVIVNLVANAIKYAPGTLLQITASDEGNTARIIFRDFGPGIPRKLQGRIFERFEQVTSSQNMGGLGLGLYIVNQIVTGHQGNIRVESEEGKGTSFIVELPL